ncbi:MAG: hypothetical protein ACOX8H_11585 [Ruminococcus sp.]|jgi:hypothetical protein
MKKEILCKKAENCFSGARSFIYTLPENIDDFFLEKLAGLGKMEVRRNFRRPFFMMKTEEGIQMKGILHDNVLKAGFLPEKWEEQKVWLEKELEKILEEDKEQ